MEQVAGNRNVKSLSDSVNETGQQHTCTASTHAPGQACCSFLTAGKLQFWQQVVKFPQEFLACYMHARVLTVFPPTPVLCMSFPSAIEIFLCSVLKLCNNSWLNSEHAFAQFATTLLLVLQRASKSQSVIYNVVLVTDVSPWQFAAQIAQSFVTWAAQHAVKKQWVTPGPNSNSSYGISVQGNSTKKGFRQKKIFLGMKLFLLLSAGRKTSAAGGCGHFPQWCTYPSVIPTAELRDTVLAAQAPGTLPSPPLSVRHCVNVSLAFQIPLFFSSQMLS